MYLLNPLKNKLNQLSKERDYESLRSLKSMGNYYGKEVIKRFLVKFPGTLKFLN